MRSNLDRYLLLVVALIFAFHFLGIVFSWYFTYFWMDVFMHLAGGFWLGMLFAYIFFERLRILPDNIGTLETLFLSIGFVSMIGVGWEFYEYLSSVFIIRDVSFGGSLPGIYFDTLKDLFNDMLGGTLSTLLYLKFKRN